jgi:hypothetical protein
MCSFFKNLENPAFICEPFFMVVSIHISNDKTENIYLKSDDKLPPYHVKKPTEQDTTPTILTE